MRANAASMVRPSTNCSPMMRMACATAVRTIGSPILAANLRIVPVPSSIPLTSINLPVSISPQVEALTRRLSD